ncbi:MAG TPA: sodium-dependent transporter [Ottowia sp.]|uniref:sodium-dependent transporter n=1 Tax=Ottowia sp. TaxID=1898956 RepID=UPI002BAE639D|nr:sodium-dependent transporter [Ottowia sp.]HMN21427.1 sodium-dependent transporter [Ottowia sp.]
MSANAAQAPSGARETFSSRSAFLFAAIGSAVGLGNIWRFPYVAYTNGGGAFIIPYLVALLTAGIPLLFLFYAIGHRYRCAPPLAFRRLHGGSELIGWWQVLICFVICTYYAAVIAWAMAYVGFSLTQAWGSDPGAFFIGSFTRTSKDVTVGFDFVPGVLGPMAVAWVITIAVLALGVQKGIARLSMVFMPLLVVAFALLVVQALMLPGAGKGLDALFTPHWAKLADGSIWMAAYGQIFFSLSIGFGIMITYSSYLKHKSDLTSTALVVGFSNSAFEVLAGIGVFAALGFMATQAGKPVSEVATSGVGLAFIGFPAIISEAPFGTVLGVLFFASLVFAGFTSMVSIVEVVIAAITDKLGLNRVSATLLTGIPCAVISLALFATTTGLNLLDVVDAFVNSFGIVAVSLVIVIWLGVGIGSLPMLRDHLNSVSSFKVGRKWQLLVGGVTPVILGHTLIESVSDRLLNGYGGMPDWFVGVFGWGMAIGLVVLAWLLARIPWRPGSVGDRAAADAAQRRAAP